MAEKINLEFHSSSKGNGFNEIDNGLKNIAKSAKSMQSVAINAFASVAKEAIPELGKSITDANMLLQGFATGGVWGGMAAGIALAVKNWTDLFKSMEEGAKRAWEYTKEQFRKGTETIKG